MTLLGARSTRTELLDEDHPPHPELARSLEQVTEANRLLGGVRSLRLGLRRLLPLPRVRLLDVGTGNGDVLRDLLAWGRVHGRGRWTGVGVDVDRTALELARRRSGSGGDRRPGSGTAALERDLRLVGGDGRALPFRAGSFDAVVSTLTLHHAGDDDAVLLLREMARVARRVVVSDLERSLPAYLGARILALTWWRSNRFTRHDGPLSVRRSFTPDELRELGRRAGLPGLRVRRRAPFRLVLEARGAQG